ncbi:iron chaperone [Mucilaginibacter flavidus]|uniref:iron chaperone n=1 Tax=Mucilaginibacter flavidus TaxID=2949309 RepID=UPI00209393A3|nr:DUF1801 domain-containing protein [Mucilaginibacter flavidus]MCO5945408.1 DUF1801 domain-containing protein [Mucilaginibacter flavidus]
MEANGQKVFDDYVVKQDEQFRPCLTELRRIILNIMPAAEESFSYQAHCFKHVYMLVGIGVTKEFCSLYTMSPPLVKSMKDELKDYKASGATIHFKPAEPLPLAIITKIVLARAKGNELLALSRGKK